MEHNAAPKSLGSIAGRQWPADVKEVVLFSAPTPPNAFKKYRPKPLELVAKEESKKSRGLEVIREENPSSAHLSGED